MNISIFWLTEVRGKVKFVGGITQSDVSSDVFSQVQRIADATGRTIIFYSDVANKNGYYNKSTGEIYVNVNGADPVAQTISHELTHSVEQTGVYGDLATLVLKRIETEGGNLNALRQAKKRSTPETV